MLNKKKRPLIIAEAGVNHNGKLINAFKLINAAKKAGADYIKFQIYKTENLVDKKIGLANYQQKNLKKKISQYNMLKKYSLGFDKFLKIIKYCNKKKIKFIATPFDLDSLKFLKKNKVDFIKISSSDLNNFEILSEVIKYNTDLILSSGLSNLNMVFRLSKLFSRLIFVKFDTKTTKVSEMEFSSIVGHFLCSCSLFHSDNTCDTRKQHLSN